MFADKQLPVLKALQSCPGDYVGVRECHMEVIVATAQVVARRSLVIYHPRVTGKEDFMVHAISVPVFSQRYSAKPASS